VTGFHLFKAINNSQDILMLFNYYSKAKIKSLGRFQNCRRGKS